MELSPFVERLRRDLSDAAAAGGPEAQAAAERLALALDPATRMMLLEALSQAAAEITGELDHEAVDVRMSGREPEFVVTQVQPDTPLAPPEPPAPPAPPEPEDDSQSRITLRLPESVKYKAEELAAKSGHSLNSWIVNVVRAATRERAVNVDIDLSSIPFLDGPGFPSGRGRGSKRMTGWV